MSKEKEKEIQLLLEAKEKYRALLISRPNVIGIGIGRRIRGGKEVDEQVLKVYVIRKIPKDALAETDIIPPTLDVRDIKVGVDVEEAKVPVAEQMFTLRTRPLVGGTSIGHTTPVSGGYFTGTLGVCITLDDQQTYILSNNHVLSVVDQLPMGERIVQPSIGDGGSTSTDIVAELDKSVPIDFGFHTVTIPLPWGGTLKILLPNPNYVDAALARVLGKPTFNMANREIHWVGYPAFTTRKITPFDLLPPLKPILPPLKPILPKVHKMGRTTGYTVGRVVDASWDGYIDYSGAFGNPSGTNQAWFEDQLKIDGLNMDWSKSGDSGSLVLDAESNRPVGLHFAGSANSGIANPIDRVMKDLGIPRI